MLRTNLAITAIEMQFMHFSPTYYTVLPTVAVDLIIRSITPANEH